MQQRCVKGLVLLLILMISAHPGHAEKEIIGPDGIWLKQPADEWRLKSELMLASDYVMADNVLDLDNKNNDDSWEYIGLDYHVDLTLSYGTVFELFARLERNGPSDSDALILGRRRVRTIYGDVESYQNKDFLPELEEIYVDLRLSGITYPVYLRSGLFLHTVGNGLSLAGYYENYGIMIHHPGEKWSWAFHYFRPDWNNKKILGHVLPQEERLGRGYQDTVADFFSLDTTLARNRTDEAPAWQPSISMQPYIGLLSDRTGAGKRSNSFSSATEQDLLGTLGVDLTLNGNGLPWGSKPRKTLVKRKVWTVRRILFTRDISITLMPKCGFPSGA